MDGKGGVVSLLFMSHLLAQDGPLGRALLLKHTCGGPTTRVTRLKESCPALPLACSHLCVPAVHSLYSPGFGTVKGFTGSNLSRRLLPG